MNPQPPTRGRSVPRAADEGPVPAPIARPGEPHGDVAAPDLAHPDLVLQQRQELHRHAELADAREVGRLEAGRVCDPDAADPQGGTEREGQPRRPVEAHLPAEGARQRGGDRLAPALRVDADPDERDRSEGEDAEYGERGEDLYGGDAAGQITRSRTTAAHSIVRPRHHLLPGRGSADGTLGGELATVGPPRGSTGGPRDATIRWQPPERGCYVALQCKHSLAIARSEGFAQPENQ